MQQTPKICDVWKTICNEVHGFRINSGEKVSIVGENGAGKSTIVKLLIGILRPSSGVIRINGKDVGDYRFDSRYDKAGVTVQNGVRYTTFTIEDNVFWGDIFRERDEEAIDEALTFAGLENMSKESLLGKDVGGIELSGGEWQKLSIARTVYLDRDFIVLDEPTSNLGSLTETDIFRKYMALAKNKTVLFVTHRISAAALADSIIVFDKGKIVQDGTHEELLKVEEGLYAKLYKEQAKWYNR